MTQKKQNLSQKLFEEAQKHIPGGVNSPVRAFKAVGGVPVFLTHAKGAYVYDADGNTYIDYIGSWGLAILGHAEPNILNVLNQALKNGLSFGAPTSKEIELAQAIKNALPSIELVRFVNSGTEATMSALRVARGFTGRDKIIKFDGCYHGHADYLLVKAGSGASACGIPDSAGVPKAFAEHTLIARYNHLDSVEKLFSQNKNQIAAVIVEPVLGNMGCVLPEKNFLGGLRKLCDEFKTVLIFDEVMTGFRVGFSGAQGLSHIQPDLTCLGKIIGGGLPVGAYGGKREIMECVAPLGNVYQAGTLSGNPLAMAVGLKTIEVLSGIASRGTSRRAPTYEKLEELGQSLENGLKLAAKKTATPLQVNRAGSMFSFFFSKTPVTDVEGVRKSDTEKFKRVFHYLLDNGIMIAPSPFEAGFISLAHTKEDIEKTVEIFERALQTL